MLFEFLPREYKIRAKKLYRTRLFILIALGVVFLSAASLLLLVPSYALVYIEKKAMTAERDAAENILSLRDNDSIRSFVVLAKAKIEAANESLDKPLFTESLRKFVAAGSSGVRVQSISFERAKEGNKMVVSGVASTRDSLLAFARALEESGSFKEVDLPVSSLARSSNIDFTIEIIELP